MEKTNSTTRPSAIEIGKRSYLYRWDIEEVTETDPETEETIISYDYYEVRLYNTPTSAAITEAVIAAMWSPSDEKKLINDYNAVVNGILEDDGYIEAYTDFLSQRKALKEQIAEDFTEWNNN